MNESKFRSTVIKLLRPLRAFPVENSLAQGQPDVACLAGWLELKVGRNSDMRPSQRVWHTGWRQGGGRSFTLTWIDRAWLLHDGLWSAAHFGRCDSFTLSTNVLVMWPRAPSSDELVSFLVNWRF